MADGAGGEELSENMFYWEVEAGVEEAWAYSGKDFLQADLWMTSIIIPGTSVLVGGKSNVAGSCIRRVDCYRKAVVPEDDENSIDEDMVFFGLQKLLSLDDSTHSFSYTAVGGNLPGFDVEGLIDYHSYFQIEAHPTDTKKSVVQWRYTSKPSPYLTAKEVDEVCFSLFDTAVGDLRTRLAAPRKTGIAHRRPPPDVPPAHLKTAFASKPTFAAQ